MRDSFVLYMNNKEIFDELTDKEAGKLIKAIFQYESTGEVPDLDKSIRLAFIPIKNSLDINNSKWEETKRKRSEAGKKGNEARWNNNRKCDVCDDEKSQEVANVANNENVIVNENVNVNVNEKDNITALSSNEIDLELFIELPLIDKSNFQIYKKDLEKWQEIYPAINNMEQEFRNMLGWCNSNPKNRKTKNGINRFINNWLSRSQDRARVVSNSTQNNVVSSSTLKTNCASIDNLFEPGKNTSIIDCEVDDTSLPF